METQIESKTPQKILAGKLCIAASICLLVGMYVGFIRDNAGKPACKSIDCKK